MKKILFIFGTIIIVVIGSAHPKTISNPIPASRPTFGHLASSRNTPFVAKEEKSTECLYPLTNGVLDNEILQHTLLADKQDRSQGLLKKYRIVSFYGHPKSNQMGILGQLSPDEMITKLEKQAQAYTQADPIHPAIPAVELITTVAQRNPGPNGLYYHETSEKDIKTYAKLAREHDALLILDIQLGRDSVIHQVKLLEKYLKLPYVFLAIDTEFHVHNGQIPGVQLGHVNGNDIQDAIQYVSKFTKDNHLPDKVIVVHQFKGDIIGNKQAIKPTNHVEVVLNFDGFGASSTKRRGYKLLVRDEPIQYGGFKLFYKLDTPLLSPSEVLALKPSPMFIDYQ